MKAKGGRTVWIDPIPMYVPPLPDTFDILFRYRCMDFGPVCLEPRYVMLTPTWEEIHAETMDLWYDIFEHPVALARMDDDGCPNMAEGR